MSMHLKILLPFKVLADVKNVTRIVIETTEGSYGFLPNRLDCTALMKPGILTYETEGSEKFVAVDRGVMVKAGNEVLVSVRNGVGNAPLGKLREVVDKELKHLDEQEKQVQSVLAKIESGFIRSLEKLKRQ